MNLVNKPCGALHGESVGCGTLLVARHYHAAASDRAHFTELLTCRPDLARLFDRSYLAPVFGDVTDGILDENLKNRDPLTSSLNFEISRECAERAADLTSSLISPERLEMYLKSRRSPDYNPLNCRCPNTCRNMDVRSPSCRSNSRRMCADGSRC